MKIEQIAVQFFTLRDQCKTKADFIETCRRVREIGYHAAQISGVDRNIIPEAEIASICADHDLTICATHEDANEILETPSKVVARLEAIGCQYTAYPYPVGIDFTEDSSVATIIKKLDAAGKVFADAGKVLTYHNHHQEFQRLNGRLILDRIYEETNPVYLQGEIDTYWVQYGGGDPVAWCRRLKNRLPLIHLKDFRITSEFKIEFCEVGSGNLNFPLIIESAEQSGCKWFIVEQDRCPGDPFDSIAQSFNYLSGLVSN